MQVILNEVRIFNDVILSKKAGCKIIIQSGLSYVKIIVIKKDDLYLLLQDILLNDKARSRIGSIE